LSAPAKQLEALKIFVTGGSRGIGAAIVRLLAERGARVAFTYAKNQDMAEQLLKTLPGEGHKTYPLLLESESSIESTVEQALKDFESFDGLVNNAGLTRDQLVLRMKSDDFDQVITSNLRGSFLVTKAFLKSFVKQRKGSIVSVTSVIGQMGNPGQTNYAASKAGLEAFSKSLAQEVASRNIRVNCVAPGFIKTEMTESLSAEQKKAIMDKIPMGRIAEASEVATTIAFLLSEDAKYITGHTLSVNGGMYMG
jgi:3-oxoacyl-[acyl-carrier protein] reductase